jgi:hypothetical protein
MCKNYREIVFPLTTSYTSNTDITRGADMKQAIILGLLLFAVSVSAGELVEDVIECNIASSMAGKYQSLRQRFSSVEDALRGATDPDEIAIATKIFNDVDPRYTPKEIKSKFFDYCVKALVEIRANEIAL